MKSAEILACAAAASIAATGLATAGPLHTARLDRLGAAPEAQIEPVHYTEKKHRHRAAKRGPDPLRAAAGTAIGLGRVGVTTATGTAHVLARGWCDFWGSCR